MRMTFSATGMDSLGAILAKLGAEAQNVATGALFDGAGIVADAYTAATNSIAAEPYHFLPRPDITGTKRLPSYEEAGALQGKSGIAKFNKTGEEVNTIVGISKQAGYATIDGKQKPVLMIARAINSGTSFMVKQPVFRKAATSSKGAAEGAIIAKAEKMFNEIIGG